MTVRTIDEIFRDFVTDGVPASGPFNPHKPDIRDTLKALTEGGDNFPDNRVIRLNNADEGTANNIVVSASVAIPAAAYQVLYILNVTQENTGPVTVSGAINRDLVTNINQPVPAGYLMPGMALLCIDTGTELRLLSYGDAEAIQAAAEAAADRAEDAAAAAEAAAGGLLSNFASRAEVEITNIPVLVSFLRTAGYFSPGDGGGALYKRSVSEPSHAGKVQSSDGAWWEIAENQVNPKQFGAKGDFKQISVSNSAGSTAVTSSAGTFTPAHVGCQMTIQTGSGTVIRRNIVAYVSDSQVTVDTSIATAYTDASAYVGTIDTTAVNNCFAYAVAKNVPVELASVYLVKYLGINQGPITIRGSGPHNSGFVFDGAADYLGIFNSGSPYTLPYNGILLADFSVRSGFEVNTSGGLITYYADMTGSPQRFVMIENVNVNTLGAGFNCGISLHNASNYSTRDVQIAGYGPILAGSIGLKVTGDQKPIDMYNTGLKIYFCDTAVQIRGTNNFNTVMEAVVFIGCVLIVNNICIDFQSDTPTPYLGVMDSNLNGYKKDIQTLNIVQIKIDNNLFYSADRTPHEATWTGIEISYNDAALTNPINNTITNNTFSGDNTPSTGCYGVTLNSLSAKNVTTQIDGNYFLGLDYAVLTYSGVTGVTIADTNAYDRVTNRAALTTVAGNIDGTADLGASGSFGMNGGHTVRYGTVTANIGAGNRVTVTYPKTMPSATRVVTVECGLPASTVAHSVDTKTASGFQVYFPGTTIGNSITFDYVAIGE